MAALDSLDSLTEVDREHLAPFLFAGPTTARSTALQYVKSDPVSKKEPQGRRILVAAVCAKNPEGGSARELPLCRDPARELRVVEVVLVYTVYRGLLDELIASSSACCFRARVRPK